LSLPTRMTPRIGPPVARRTLAAVVLATYVASCTHTPTGQRAFETFDQCIAANLGIAAGAGTAIGALGAALTKQVTGDRGTATKVGVTAGVAAAVMIGLAAWKKCAAVYNTSERVGAPAPAQPPVANAPRRRPGISVERLDVRVEGTENDPPTPEFAISYSAESPDAKDIKAKFHHKVEIVRFMADDNDKLMLADASGQAMKDSAGHPIPLEAAMRMPRDRLAWVTIAEDGKDDYVEDVVIQQVQHETYRHKLQIPPRAQLPLPLPVPMRYTVTVEADAFKSSRTVDFALLPTGERPKRFSSQAGGASNAPAAAPAATPAPAAAPTAARPEDTKAAANGFTPTHKLKRGVPLYSDASPQRKQVGRVAKDTPVQVAEHAQGGATRTADWVRIVTSSGTGGWLPAAELVEAK